MWKPKLEGGGDAPLFRRIVQSIADDVCAGRLAVGAKLPPHRDLADELLVARGTVARAYREAEKLGLVRSEVGRGTHVLAPDGGERQYASLLVPPTVAGDFSTNVPLSGIDPDPADVLRQLADRPDRRSLLRYQPPGGALRHRRAGVRWLERMGVDARADEVLLCAGAQHALYVVLSHLAERSRVLYVEELTYPGIHGIAETLRLRLVPVAMDAHGIVPEDLLRARKRHGAGVLYCMPTIHNPMGAVIPEARRREIAEIARAEDLFIVEDAANRMLASRPPAPIASHAPERAFVVASVSKVLSPGLRVAFLLAPRGEIAALSRRAWATHWMASPLGAEIVAMWIENGVVDRTLRRKQREAARRQAIARAVFGRKRVQAHPESLHLWLTLPSAWGADQLASVASRQELLVTPSSAFWARPTAPPNAIRSALGGVDKVASLERGLEKLRAVVGASARAVG